MGAKMKNKRLYLLTIFYIVVFATLFKFFYDEVEVTSITTVIALLGIICALGTNFAVNLKSKKGGKDDSK